VKIFTGLFLVAFFAAVDGHAQRPEVSAQCVAKPTRDCVLATARVTQGGLAGIQTLVHVFDAQMEMGNLTAATLTIEQIKMAGAALQDDQEQRNVQSALVIFNTVILAARQASSEQVTNALETIASIAEQAQESGYISLLFATLAEGHAKAGRAIAATDVMGVALLLAGAVKDDMIRRLTLTEVAVSQAAVQSETRHLSDARVTAAKLEGNRRRDALSRIAEAEARAQANAGETTKALQIAATIDNDPARVQALCAVAEANMQASHPMEASEALTRAKAVVSTLSDPSARDRSLARVAQVQAEAGNLTGAMVSAADLKDDVWRIVALEIIAAKAPPN
jgi:hypothetical protein